MSYNVWAAAIVYFVHSGFNDIVTMAEEIKNQARAASCWG
jgi:amino acid transporter